MSKECIVKKESLSLASRVTGVSIMPLSVGVNVRVTGHCNQGGRKYMEDTFIMAFERTEDDKDLKYAFFGIFDGHGGGEAATFAKDHLMKLILKEKNFWSDRDEDVLRAIRDGYVNTHHAMWRELDKWPRTASGLPSTAGTTASIAFIRKGKIYIGHVGDSGIVLGYQVDGDPQWRAEPLTKDHKPESGPEMMRIHESGGKVVSKSGVPRVVWNRPRIGHKGPVRRSTHIDEIPFLAVARSLGDLWSYNSELNTFVVSPEPDVQVITIDAESHRCLIFGTDGLWNMLTPQAAVAIVQAADRHNEQHFIASQQMCGGHPDNVQLWINPSKSLVDRALEKWSIKRLRADNTSVVTLMLDPPGPSRNEVLLSQKDCVLGHYQRTPAPTVHVNSKKVNCNPDIPSVLRPLSVLNHNDVLKTPDVPNEVEENKIEIKSESVDSVSLTDKIKENLTTSSSLKLESHDTSIETPIRETVQDPEVSSTKMLVTEETAKLEDEEATVVKVEKIEKDAECSTNISNQDECNTSDNENVPKIKRPPEEVEKDDSNPPNVIHQSAFLSKSNGITPSTTVNPTDGNNELDSEIQENEIKNKPFNGSSNKQHALFSSRSEVRGTRRRHSLNSHSRNVLVDSSSLEPKTYVNSRLKSRSTKMSMAGSTVEDVRNSTSKIKSRSPVGSKRRHSAIQQSVANNIEDPCVLQEPCVKRRTRSEDRPNPVDENDPANQSTKNPSSSLNWPTAEVTQTRGTGAAATVSVQERLSSLNNFQRNLGKKDTPVKAIRRSSIKGLLKQLWARERDQGRSTRSNNCNDRRINRSISIIGSTDSSAVPQRWLRSDTMAATPVKTLRSRNVDITGHTISAHLVHQYGMVKQSRLSLPSKLKQSSNNGFLQSSRVRSSSLSSSIKQSNNNTGSGTCSTISPTNTGCNSSSGMAKRVKSLYNPSARSLTTPSRIKRLGK